MSRLSKCIFEWSSEDLQRLRDAKRSELLAKNVPVRDDSDVLRYLSKRELALHCRRQTRGVEETTRLISELIEAFTGDQGLDTMGFPLLHKEKIFNEWESQKRHVVCIQDPSHYSLYTETGTLKKGSEILPTLRCARGSTSLESFHLHLARFIPGSTASDVLFQAYLLDGIVRWNEDRARQTVKEYMPGPSSYSGILRHAANDISHKVLHKKIIPEYQPPRKYTGELIGVEYLYDQTGRALQEFSLDPDSSDSDQVETQLDAIDDQIDKGFEKVEVEDMTVPLVDVEHLSDSNRPQTRAPRESKIYGPSPSTSASTSSSITDDSSKGTNSSLDPNDVSFISFI
ncbi:uncharacterized protein LOC132758299 [Ruditapes philippinarum]|uniref:uncharacterized protein LOC132758299 n=1 Tax=Ruditapes philippinarum TaxID=129788 RepID=UPI00295A9689|nr:uncharacterized protein LOC132758299 [Ruditapes philippinarum]